MTNKDDSTKSVTVLVTGCAGFIGYPLCRRLLLNMEIRVVGFDECNAFYDPTIKRAKLKELSTYERFSVAESLASTRALQVETVFHLAAQPNVRFCEANQLESFRCNQELTKKLLDALPPSCHVIYISSSSVYGRAPIPWGVTTKPMPQGIYGMSKLECEALIQRRGAPSTIVRPFSVVGPGIRPDLVPAIFVDRLLNRDSVEIYGDGSACRDFTHVDDLIDALVSIMDKRRFASDVGIYNIGSGNPRSVQDLLNIVKTEVGRKARVIYTPPNPHEFVVSKADSSKATSDLGFVPKRTLESAIKDIVRSPRKITLMVVVATQHRENLLRTRALPSIVAQTVAPDKVCVVVDDASTNLASLTKDFPRFQFLRNSRTKGASGAWNCGVMEVTDLPAQRYCYLAFLDDDDCWEPNHLEKCLEKVGNGLTDMVVSGVVRHNTDDDTGRSQSIPENLRQEDFFIGNPHVQGSNLFLSLRLFYRAGMFDEYLPSCTDRDLCIRLFDVAPDLNIQTTEVHTVHHFAESDRLRLSSPSTTAKVAGVHRFAFKHSRRMTAKQRELYWERAKALFDIDPPKKTVPDLQERYTIQSERLTHNYLAPTSLLWNGEVTCLLFGVISNKPHVVAGLMIDISRNCHNSRLVLLANGHDPEPFESLLRLHGVPGVVIRSEKHLDIAEARTRVQMHCGLIWKRMTSIDAVVIMDDDKRLPQEWFSNLCVLLKKDPRPDGGFIGPDMDSPPLPAAFTARTSLIDLYYAKLGEEEQFSELVGDDLFYDLSENCTHHLEYPASCKQVHENAIESVLKGIPISRKATPNKKPVRSLQRGGCCVVLFPELLTEFPNPLIRIGDVVTRRSDMLWAETTGRTFIQHPALAVRHERENDLILDASAFLLTAQKDLLGAALCRPTCDREHFLKSRLKQLSANILRIQGLETALAIAPQAYFCYQRWVNEVINPIFAKLDNLKNIPISGQSPADHTKVPPEASINHFRVATARRLLLNENPDLHEVEFVGLGSEGVTFRSSDLKFKVMDCYRPRKSTYKGEIPGLRRSHGSTIIVLPFVDGKPYKGRHGTEIVKLLRKLQDERLVCFRNWKPSNLITNDSEIHFIDYGRDVVGYQESEYDSMVRRAYLSWRYPNHGETLKLYCRKALTENIPQLDGVELMVEAINDRQPDKDLYDFVNGKLRHLSYSRILDFGSGTAKFQRHTEIQSIVNYDPMVHDDLYVFDCINKISGAFDVVLCVRVLCVLSDQELVEVLKQIRDFTKPDSGRVIFTMCDPRGIDRENPDESSSFIKKLSTGRKRREYYRPLRVVKMEMIRAGFELIDESIFWRVNYNRFERHPSQWCCIAKLTGTPRHTLLIKTCLMEHASILQRVQHLVETLPCGVETILVLDGRRENFQREYDQADEDSFRNKAHRLLRERWIDVLLEPPTEPEVSNLHNNWFGFHPDFSKGKWTHDSSGTQYASTFYGLENCRTDLVLQVDSDLMVFPGDEKQSRLSYSLFDKDPLALTWALPIASRHPKPYTTGHRFEVRGCMVSIGRLQQMLRSSRKDFRALLSHTHWYRLVDQIIQETGEFKSYRGGHQTPFFIHPRNSVKEDLDQYLLAIDAVQSGRIHPRQYDMVDWVGFPAGRDEHFIILIRGRNVDAGRMLRCIQSIANNMEQADDIGLVVIDDSSSRQSAKFLSTSLLDLIPPESTTFVARRQRVGIQENLLLGCRDLCMNPQSVICTVDLDDALLGRPMTMIRHLYINDPSLEAAFGGCVRVDKPARYQIDDSRPVPPRNARGQPYWTHLRTFRKALFDRILLEDLNVNRTAEDTSGSGADWAFSVPIWEQARKAKALQGDLYLYEPDRKYDGRRLEEGISRVMALPPYSCRRYHVAVVGDSNIRRAEAFEVGRQLAKAGYVVVTGGLDGVMLEASRGAKDARSGVPTIGIIPGTDPGTANPFVDYPIATGLGQNRNGVIALTHAVVVVGGRAGTYSEVSLAWSARRLVISMRNVQGCSMDIADKPFDSRIRYKDIPHDEVYGADRAEDVVVLLDRLLPLYVKLHSRL